MESEKIFQGRLKALRTTREMSQDELARKAELPSTTISHFESGKRKPSFHNLRKLADALDASIDYLIGRTDEIGGALPQAEIFRHYENLTEDDRALADDFMERLAQRNKDKT